MMAAPSGYLLISAMSLHGVYLKWLPVIGGVLFFVGGAILVITQGEKEDDEE
jgi:hypothetical protein